MIFPISVIIPAFNPGNYLVEALESVQEQTLQPLEIIIIDDGSYPKIRIPDHIKIPMHLVRQNNSGQAAARNAGIKMAKGDWIAFLDADDVWHPKKLEIQVDLLKKNPDVNCIGCRAVLVDSVGKFIGTGPGSFSDHYVFVGRPEFQTQSPRAILVPSMAVVKRQSALEIGGFNSKYQPIEDLVFFDKYFSVGGRVIISEVPLLKRRIHEESLTLKYKQMLKSYLAWADEIVERESGEKPAQRLRGNAYLVTGLSALARGEPGDARVLLKKASRQSISRADLLLPFLFTCLDPGISEKFRKSKRRIAGRKAEKLWGLVK